MFLKVVFSFILGLLTAQAFSFDLSNVKLLDVFKKAYPKISFSTIYDTVKKDYLVLVRLPEMPLSESLEFYWAGGRLLTEEALQRISAYTPILYEYPYTIKDPANMSEEERAKLIEESKSESEQTEAGSPMFFYDYLYGSFSKSAIEKNIVETTFLGLKLKIHKRILDKARTVEKKILESAKTDKDIQQFLDELTVDAYFWRVIKGTDRKSFHSLGIAIDVLPKNLHGKQSYWAWARDKIGEDWATLPFSERWFPPKKVIEIFESEGFIWGGKWSIWDTMHFEYRPELLLFRDEYVQH